MTEDTRKKDSQRTGSAERGKPRRESPDTGAKRSPRGGSGGGTPPEKYEVSRDQATHGVEDKHGEKRNTM